MTWYIRNGSYPHLDGVDTADAYRLQAPAPTYAWDIIDGGYPFLTTHRTPEPFAFSEPYPTWIWKVVHDTEGQAQSEDYPVLHYERPIIVTPVHQHPYICVYDMKTKQKDFGTNGLRILSPTSCKVTEELGGTYEVVMEHPITTDTGWEHVLELNVLKALGQLFPIYRVDTKISGASGTVTAYGRHISYQLNDAWIRYAQVNAKTGQEAIDQIFAAMDTRPSPDGVDYTFSGTSDIVAAYGAELEDVTPIAALIGTDSTSLINQIGGELYRDNFYFSINERMEGARDNAFQIRVGLNLTGIERSVDYTDFCTYLMSYDNFGNKYAVSYAPMVRFAHNVVRGVMFKYDEPDYDALVRDTHKYFESKMFPVVTYKVTVADLKNNPDYKQFGGISRYKVGDSGWIYDDRLGMATHQKVIRTVKDAITGETLEITFGNLESGLTRPERMQNVVATKSEKFQIRQQTAAEAKGIKTWSDLKQYTWGQARKFTWGQLRKE